MGINFSECYERRPNDQIETVKKEKYNSIKKFILSSNISQDYNSNESKSPNISSNYRSNNYSTNSSSTNIDVIDTNLFFHIDDFHESDNKLDNTLDEKNYLSIKEYINSDSNKNNEEIIIISHSYNNNDIVIITNLYLYVFSKNCNFLRKINYLNLEFFTLTTDENILMIHLKNDSNGNYFIYSDDNIKILVSLCNVIFNSFSIIKFIYIIPNKLINKIKKIQEFDKFKDIYNEYLTLIKKSVIDVIDLNEIIFKIVPITKLGNNLIEKILIITNKKIIEKDYNTSSIDVIPYAILKGIEMNNYNIRLIFQDYLEKDNHIYRSLFSNKLKNLIKYAHSNECLTSLSILK